MKKILLLGSGELGKEFVIAAKRAGQYVVACDRYENAPAMQVADEHEVFNMLDGDALTAVVEKHRPDIIVPEIEAIRTERLFDFEKEGIQVVPSARAVNYTMPFSLPIACCCSTSFSRTKGRAAIGLTCCDTSNVRIYRSTFSPLRQTSGSLVSLFS